MDSKKTPLLGADLRRALTGVYTVDPVCSAIGFSVRRAMVTTVRGGFSRFEGVLELDGARPTRSRASLRVRTGSLDTGAVERDVLVTGPGFLDSDAFPFIVFQSTGITPSGGDRFRMSGNLRIRNVALPVVTDLEFSGATRDADGRTRVCFEGSATLCRSDWGLTWRFGDVLVGDRVRIDFDICAVQEPPVTV